jgi:hypothetical protein
MGTPHHDATRPKEGSVRTCPFGSEKETSGG